MKVSRWCQVLIILFFGLLKLPESLPWCQIIIWFGNLPERQPLVPGDDLYVSIPLVAAWYQIIDLEILPES
jgi:hypothetical protein